MKKLLILILIVFLNDCSSAPTPLSNRVPINHDNIINKELMKASQDRDIKVNISRDCAFPFITFPMLLLIDEEQIAAFDSCDTLTIYLKKGNYVFTTYQKWSPSASLGVKIDTNKSNNYRISTGMGGVTLIHPEP